MVADFGKLDYWRQHFRSADSDIFVVIEHAILIAASDYPTEFRNRRDQITERIFSCQLPRCFGCDRVKQQTFHEEEEEFREGGGIRASDIAEEFKVNGGSDEKQADDDLNWVSSNYSFDESEALTEEIEEENQMVGEVLRIKETIANKDYESDARLFESLRRLQLMRLTFEVLKATKIGKALNGLRRHKSKQISQIVSSLIEGWKILVDEWKDATAGLTESTPESNAPSVAKAEEDDGGLPSPPLDEGALLTTPAAMELSQFFHGISDDVCPQTDDESGRRKVNKKKPASQSQSQSQRPSTTKPKSPPPEDPLNPRKKSDSAVGSGPGRPAKPLDPAMVNASRNFQKKSTSTSQVNEKAACAKLEATKRKLHEGYQQAENAKRQRTIQVMELHDLPKRGLCRRQIFIKQDSGSRHRTNPRR